MIIEAIFQLMTSNNKFKPTYEKKEQRQIDSMKSKGKEYYKELSPENQKLFDTSMEKVEVLMSRTPILKNRNK